MPVVKVGDVIALPTSKGLALAQVAQRDAQHGALIRVLQPLYEVAPHELAAAARQPERFYTYFPVGAAIARGIVRRLGNAPLPDPAHPVPLMRMAGNILTTGEVVDWWLWDGERSWRAGQLTPDLQKLSIREVVNDTLLRERIETDWRPEYRTGRPGTGDRDPLA